MIAAAITRILKFDPLIRMIAGVVSVADTRYSVSDTVTHTSKLHAKSTALVFRWTHVIALVATTSNRAERLLRYRRWLSSRRLSAPSRSPGSRCVSVYRAVTATSYVLRNARFGDATVDRDGRSSPLYAC